LAGIYFTFLFSLAIMVLTTAHFLVGAAVEKVYRYFSESFLVLILLSLLFFVGDC
jgi:hypothetical protein